MNRFSSHITHHSSSERETVCRFTLIELLVAPACFRSESEKSIKV